MVNSTLTKAKAEFIVFLAGDDYLHKDLIKMKMDVMNKFSQTVLVGSIISQVDEENNFLINHRQSFTHTQYGNKNWIRHGMIWAAQGLLARRNTSLFFDKNIKLASDYKYFVDLIGKKGEIRFINKELAFYRKHKNSTTLNKNKRVQLFKDHFKTRVLFLKYDYIKLFDSLYGLINFSTLFFLNISYNIYKNSKKNE